MFGRHEAKGGRNGVQHSTAQHISTQHSTAQLTKGPHIRGWGESSEINALNGHVSKWNLHFRLHFVVHALVRYLHMCTHNHSKSQRCAVRTKLENTNKLKLHFMWQAHTMRASPKSAILTDKLAPTEDVKYLSVV